MILVLAAVVVGAGGGLALSLGRTGSTAPNPPATLSPSVPKLVGWAENRPVPNVPLIGENGKRTSLAAFRGKVVVLSPFLTLCGEVCPITTGAFLQLQRSVAAAGLAGKVVFVEATVDPHRDTPARLRAFARLTQVTFPMLTGTPANIRKLWNFFGIGYKRVPQGHPPDIDWWTHKPLTYDVEHVDAVFFIDPGGVERAFIGGMADVGGKLPGVLRGLLSPTGRNNLAHPVAAWTEPQALADIGHLLGRTIPPGS